MARLQCRNDAVEDQDQATEQSPPGRPTVRAREEPPQARRRLFARARRPLGGKGDRRAAFYLVPTRSGFAVMSVLRPLALLEETKYSQPYTPQTAATPRATHGSSLLM